MKKIDKDDISTLVSYILGDTTDSFNNEVADVNGDEAINIADVAAIIDLMQNSVADETKNLVTIFYDGSTATVCVSPLIFLSDTKYNNMELTFEKWEDGRWFVVLPEYDGDQEDLEMVDGADCFLDFLTEDGLYVTVDVNLEDPGG